MNDGKFYMTDATGREICIDNVHEITITSSETEIEGIRSFYARSFSGTFEAIINKRALRVITGTESNNERRRHHEPMRRRRSKFRTMEIYKNNKVYTHYGRRTV